jgi:hypothetical protein
MKNVRLLSLETQERSFCVIIEAMKALASFGRIDLFSKAQKRVFLPPLPRAASAFFFRHTSLKMRDAICIEESTFQNHPLIIRREDILSTQVRIQQVSGTSYFSALALAWASSFNPSRFRAI